MSATKQPKQESTTWYNSNATLIASNWLRTLSKFHIKKEIKKTPIEYTKYTRERSPLFSVHIVPIIVQYALSSIPIPFKPNNGPLPKISDDNTKTIVIEHGSCSIRAGFAGDDAPYINIPSLIGIRSKDDNEEIMIGNEILDLIKQNDSTITIKKVIERGRIIEWNYIKSIWQYILKGIDISSVNVHIIDSRMDRSKQHLEKLTKIFFEELKGKAFIIWNSCIVSLYASGITTGINIQFGYGLTQIVPIYEGYGLIHAVKIIEFGKQDMDENKDYNGDYKAIFKQQQIGKYVVDAIKKCDVDIRSDLFNNICIAGGNSMYDGIAEFMENEIMMAMKEIFNDNEYRLNIHISPGRGSSAWIGGSILGSMS